MYAINYFKAHVFHDVNAAIDLVNKKANKQNINFLKKLTGVDNTDFVPKEKNIEEDIIRYQKEALVGKFISPKIATRKLDKIVFNGHGEIVSLPSILKSQDFKMVVNNIIPPLKEVPLKGSAEKNRTSAEYIIDMACVIRSSKDISIDDKKLLEGVLKKIYLSEKLSMKSIDSFSFLAMQCFSFDSKSKTAETIIQLIENIEKEIHTTKNNHNYNYNENLFESMLAEDIVNNPSKEMNASMEVIKNIIYADFVSLDDIQQQDLFDRMYLAMRNDKAAWRKNIPEIDKFLETGEADDFIKALNTSNPLKQILIMHLAAMHVEFSPTFKHMRRAETPLYNDVIRPQRALRGAINAQFLSDYQMRSKSESSGYLGERLTDKRQIPEKGLTVRNQKMMPAEKTIAAGMSGNAHLLNSLFLSLEGRFKGFDIEQARLLAAAFLTYSGGHSLSETYTAFGDKDNPSFKPLSYLTLSSSGEYAKKAIDASYDKLIENALALNENGLKE